MVCVFVPSSASVVTSCGEMIVISKEQQYGESWGGFTHAQGYKHVIEIILQYSEKTAQT